jgi:phage terminase small subunit
MNFENFTSLPPAQEQQFVVYEQQSAASQQKATMFAIIAGAITLVISMAVYFGVSPAAEHKEAKPAVEGSTLAKPTK